MKKLTTALVAARSPPRWPAAPRPRWRKATPLTAAPAGAKTTGTAKATVRRIDAAGQKLVIKHGDIKGMDMPGR